MWVTWHDAASFSYPTKQRSTIPLFILHHLKSNNNMSFVVLGDDSSDSSA